MVCKFNNLHTILYKVQKETYTGMPTHDGTGTMKGNAGNGYARITYIGNDK